MTRWIGLALALAILGPAQAQAVVITGFAQGEITINRSAGLFPGGQVYNFTPGEGLFLTYSFDTARSQPLGGFGTDDERYRVVPSSFRLTTEGGFNASGESFFITTGGEAVVRDGPTDLFSLNIGSSGSNIELTFFDPTGTVLSSTALPTLAEIGRFSRGRVVFNRERFNADEGFEAILTPVVDASNFPVPEPSTFALGGIGLAILGLGRARRRRVWATA